MPDGASHRGHLKKKHLFENGKQYSTSVRVRGGVAIVMNVSLCIRMQSASFFYSKSTCM